MGETGRGDAVTSVSDDNVAEPAEPEDSLTVAAAAVVAARWNINSDGRGWAPSAPRPWSESGPASERETASPPWNRASNHGSATYTASGHAARGSASVSAQTSWEPAPPAPTNGGWESASPSALDTPSNYEWEPTPSTTWESSAPSTPQWEPSAYDPYGGPAEPAPSSTSQPQAPPVSPAPRSPASPPPMKPFRLGTDRDGRGLLSAADIPPAASLFDSVLPPPVPPPDPPAEPAPPPGRAAPQNGGWSPREGYDTETLDGFAARHGRGIEPPRPATAPMPTPAPPRQAPAPPVETFRPAEGSQPAERQRPADSLRQDEFVHPGESLRPVEGFYAAEPPSPADRRRPAGSHYAAEAQAPAESTRSTDAGYPGEPFRPVQNFHRTEPPPLERPHHSDTPHRTESPRPTGTPQPPDLSQPLRYVEPAARHPVLEPSTEEDGWEDPSEEIPAASWPASTTPGMAGLQGQDADPSWIARLARPASPEADWIARPGRTAPLDPDWIARMPGSTSAPDAQAETQAPQSAQSQAAQSQAAQSQAAQSQAAQSQAAQSQAAQSQAAQSQAPQATQGVQAAPAAHGQAAPGVQGVYGGQPAPGAEVGQALGFRAGPGVHGAQARAAAHPTDATGTPEPGRAAEAAARMPGVEPAETDEEDDRRRGGIAQARQVGARRPQAPAAVEEISSWGHQPARPSDPVSPAGAYRNGSGTGNSAGTYAAASASGPPYPSMGEDLDGEPETTAEIRDDGPPRDSPATLLPRREPKRPDVPSVPTVPDPLVEPAEAPPLVGGELSRIATYLRHDEAGEEFERTEGFDVAEILEAVRQVPDVRDARLRWNPGGVHTLRLDLVDGADGGEVSRQVARLLKDRMGLAAEPNEPTQPRLPAESRVSTEPRPFTDEPTTDRPRLHRPYVTGSQTGDRVRPRDGLGPVSGPVSGPVGAVRGATVGGAEQASGRPLPRPAGDAPPRVVLDHVRVTTLGLEANVEVRLVVPSGGYAVGNARGPAVDAYLLRLAGVACGSAVDRLLIEPATGQTRGRVFIEHVALVPFGGCEVAIVVLLLVYGGGYVEQLAGSALVSGDPRQAVVRATLSALNRRLEALLA